MTDNDDRRDPGQERIEIVDKSGACGNRWRVCEGRLTLGLRNFWIESNALPNEESAERVICEARNILESCASPTLNDQVRTGLVCGYVQSGKTMSMTAVSALARDNGFQLIILMAGVTKNLVEQTWKRLESHLRSGGGRWDWVMFNNPRQGHAQALEGLVRGWADPNVPKDEERTLFIIVMKQHQHLEALSQLLAAVDLRGVPSIIFDDEADQASLNTRPTDPSASITHQRIDELRARVPQHTFLQYTATPQAPLLISVANSLSAEFAELVSPGENYTGGEVFFVQNQRLVHDIPAADIFDHKQLPDVPPASLVDALQLFLVGVAAGKLAADQNHRSMLVHPHQRKDVHRHYLNWVNVLRDDWYRILRAQGEEPDRDGLLAEFRLAYDDLAETIAEESPTWEDVVRMLPSAINDTVVSLVNSEIDAERVEWDNSYSHILVGGEKLGRGYTVKGLTVTYMPRSPGNWTADTIQQRARFFGYHRKYLGFCRVFLHPDIRFAYVAYVRHEQHMRDQLAKHRGQPLSEWRRVFYLNQAMRATRHNVLTTPYLRVTLNEQNWFTPRSPHRSPEGGGSNRRLLASALRGVCFAPDEQYPQHKVAIVRLKDVFESLLSALVYSADSDSTGLCAINCHITEILDVNPDADCAIYQMANTERNRKVTKDKTPLQQGGSGNYRGDAFVAEPNLVSIQIYNLRVFREDGAKRVLEEWLDVPAVAIRLPHYEDIIVQPLEV